jgi:hypothetical protein
MPASPLSIVTKLLRLTWPDPTIPASGVFDVFDVFDVLDVLDVFDLLSVVEVFNMFDELMCLMWPEPTIHRHWQRVGRGEKGSERDERGRGAK